MIQKHPWYNIDNLIITNMCFTGSYKTLLVVLHTFEIGDESELQNKFLGIIEHKEKILNLIIDIVVQ